MFTTNSKFCTFPSALKHWERLALTHSSASGQAKRWAEPEQWQWAGLDRHPACAVQPAAPTLSYYRSCKELSAPARKVKVPATEEREDRSAWAARILKEPRSSHRRLPLLEVGRSDVSILQFHRAASRHRADFAPGVRASRTFWTSCTAGGTRPHPAPRQFLAHHGLPR